MSSDSGVCASRRNLLQAGLAGIAAGVAGIPATASADPPKLSKASVMYQDHPKDGHQCSECVHFEPPNACKIVEGDISPAGWCGVWAPKPA